MPTERMAPPPGASPPMRMTASWSGSNDPTAYKSVTRRSVPNGELPSDPQQTDRQAPTRHRNYAKSPSCNSSSRSEPDRRRRDEERPQQRPTLSARQRGIGVLGYRARSVEIPHDDGVDLLIKRLDPRNRPVDEFAGRDLTAGESLYQLPGRTVRQPCRVPLRPHNRQSGRGCRGLRVSFHEAPRGCIRRHPKLNPRRGSNLGVPHCLADGFRRGKIGPPPPQALRIWHIANDMLVTSKVR